MEARNAAANKDANAVYDRLRCRTCGILWSSHPRDTVCNQYRPGGVTDVGTKGALAEHVILLREFGSDINGVEKSC